MPEPKLVEAVAREPEMVRRVAEAMLEGYRRAINESLGPKWMPPPWAELDGASKRYFCAAAREGIQAMREPSGPMWAAWTGIQVLSDASNRNTPLDASTAAEVWESGINAALAASDGGEGL